MALVHLALHWQLLDYRLLQLNSDVAIAYFRGDDLRDLRAGLLCVLKAKSCEVLLAEGQEVRAGLDEQAKPTRRSRVAAHLVDLARWGHCSNVVVAQEWRP